MNLLSRSVSVKALYDVFTSVIAKKTLETTGKE